MSDREIRLTLHATKRGHRFGLDRYDVEKIIREGDRSKEGRHKTRYALRTKKGVFVAICEESPDLIMVITITKGR